ncbi:MAG TPA: RDD family protein [Blastocatellia bacterium]|nr:RDD family protein [Blastocatellia bacterium]
MARFCPYCGKQLSDRAKFCPHCGKAPPMRERPSGVTVREAGSGATRPLSAMEEPGRSRATAPENQKTAAINQAGEGEAERPPAGSARLSSTLSAERPARTARTNGSAARPTVTAGGQRRFAPATHALIGAEEQAGFGLRYGAWMFDFLITLIAMMTFTFIVTAVSKKSVVGSNRDLVLVALLTLLMFVLNYVVLAGRDGQSAGMRILGIRIARIDGRPFTMRDAALRHLVGYPVSMAAFFLGFLWMLWDPRQQGWHDKIARTLVVVSR